MPRASATHMDTAHLLPFLQVPAVSLARWSLLAWPCSHLMANSLDFEKVSYTFCSTDSSTNWSL